MEASGGVTDRLPSRMLREKGKREMVRQEEEEEEVDLQAPACSFVCAGAHLLVSEPTLVLVVAAMAGPSDMRWKTA